MEIQKQLRYIMYCRKSTEAKDRQVLSIQSQKRELDVFAQANGLNVVCILEESQSAFKLGRPVFNRMMDMIYEGTANAILTWKPDRLARNASDGGRVIQALDDNVLQEIRTPYERFQQQDNRMMIYVLFGMSNDFSRQISANVKRGNRQKYERGEYVGHAPLGYLNVKVGLHHNIIPDPERSDLIKLVFAEYATGNYSVADIARKAHEWGLRTSGGMRIAKSGMYTLLRRSAYCGIYLHAGELHQGSYETLISKALFDQVQLIINNKQKPHSVIRKHTFKGLIRCAECGCSITAETKTKQYKRTNRTAEYTYYRCTRKRGVCSQSAITESELENMLIAHIGQIEIDEEVWQLGIKLLQAKNKDEFEHNRKMRQQIERKLEHTKKYLEVLLNMRVRDEITAEEYQSQKEEYVKEKILLTERINDLDDSTDNWLERAEKFFETSFNARSIMIGDDMDAKKRLIQAVGSNLFLEDKKLHFEFKKPYDILLKPNIRNDVQAG